MGLSNCSYKFSVLRLSLPPELEKNGQFFFLSLKNIFFVTKKSDFWGVLKNKKHSTLNIWNTNILNYSLKLLKIKFLVE